MKTDQVYRIEDDLVEPLRHHACDELFQLEDSIRESVHGIAIMEGIYTPHWAGKALDLVDREMAPLLAEKEVIKRRLIQEHIERIQSRSGAASAVLLQPTVDPSQEPEEAVAVVLHPNRTQLEQLQEALLQQRLAQQQLKLTQQQLRFNRGSTPAPTDEQLQEVLLQQRLIFMRHMTKVSTGPTSTGTTPASPDEAGKPSKRRRTVATGRPSRSKKANKGQLTPSPESDPKSSPGSRSRSRSRSRSPVTGRRQSRSPIPASNSQTTKPANEHPLPILVGMLEDTNQDSPNE
jgi:hypothetical protein